MSNSENQGPGKPREISSLNEEEDLWDLEDDTVDASVPEVSDTPPTPKPAIIEASPAVSNSIVDDSFEALSSPDQNLYTSEETAPPQDEASTEEPKSKIDTNAHKKEKLSAIEKISLAVVAASLLGLAVYGYI